MPGSVIIPHRAAGARVSGQVVRVKTIRQGLSVWVAAIGLLGALFAMPASAAPGGFSRLAGGVEAFASDGSRYVAWQLLDSSEIVVLDTRTGRRGDVEVSPGCKLDDMGGKGGAPPADDGRFLIGCQNQDEAWLDAKTGVITPLPLGYGWYAAGPLYFEGEVMSSLYSEGGVGAPCVQNAVERRSDEFCIALYEIATEALTVRPQSEVGDLSRPGAPVVCAALKRTLVRERTEGYEYLFSFSEGLLARRKRVNSRVVQIEGCRGRKTLLHSSGEPEDFDIRGGVLTWDTGHAPGPTAPEDGPFDGSLFSYTLAARRLCHWKLPKRPLKGAEPLYGAFGYSTHTSNTVFWVAAERVTGRLAGTVESSSVYTSPLN